MRTKLTIAYVGTAYAGWQRQDDVPTVQAAVEAAVAAVAGGPITIHGAGRTDAGVHARGQVAHFDSDKELDPHVWRRAINAYLDDAVRVVQAERVPGSFHARHSARGKAYRYTLTTAEICSPFLAPFAWHVGPDLDLHTLRVAANALLGPMDQRAFATQPKDGGRPHRPLGDVRVEPGDETVTLWFEGRSFLRHAVRGMTGTVVEVALRKRRLESIRTAAETGDRTLAGATAPAHGLCLEAVRYQDPD